MSSASLRFAIEQSLDELEQMVKSEPEKLVEVDLNNESDLFEQVSIFADENNVSLDQVLIEALKMYMDLQSGYND